MGIVYDCAERINGKFTDAAPEVVVEAWLTLGYRKTAAPVKSSAAVMGNRPCSAYNEVI